MNFAIRYLSDYRYDAPVTESMNAIRVRPVESATQRVEEFSVRVNPDVRLSERVDYFGTHVHEFEVVRAHDRLVIDARARVSTTVGGEPPNPPWSALGTPAYVARGGEFLISPEEDRTALGLDALVDRVRADTPLAAVVRMCEVIPDRFEYRRGVTFVNSTVADVLSVSAGVCQDFVHLGLAILRALGIASRYCSGYLFVPGSEADGASTEVETHAWLEALIPGGEDRAATWVGLDPTNRGYAGARHVKIGHGRNYDDVPPVKGIFRGPAGGVFNASVTMTRLDDAG